MTDRPIDLGLVLGSTNKEIWEAEVARNDGLQAVAKACACDNPRCGFGAGSGARPHVQMLFAGRQAALLTIAEQLAPHVGEDSKDLYPRFRALYASFVVAEEKTAPARRRPFFRLFG